ncbi:MAG: hypothetical protein Q8P12_01430 [bacterium]|nr:hypothetical protein [bacterium]
MAQEKRKYKDRAAYMVAAVSRRRKRLKEMAVELKGGKCYFCGYSKCPSALEFHHLSEEDKSFDLGTRGLTRSWKRIEEELKKWILVCANCHREIHSCLLQPPEEISA